MFKECRLRKRASFRYVYHNGTAVSGELMTLIFVKTKGVKVGVSVSKKIGKSVVRNLVKRRINENFMRLMPRLNGEYNYVVVAKPGIKEAGFHEIGSALDALLNKAGHLKNV